MKKITQFTVFLALLLGFAAISAFGLDVPPLKGRINDNAGVLSSSQSGELENYLAAVEKATGAQIALLTVPSLKGESLE